MAKLAIKKASTDVTVYVFIQASNVTTGAGLTGLVYNTTDLVASYVRPLAARQALSLATLAAVDSAHSDGGFKEIDATNMPGVYRLDLPDAVCATGVNSAVVMLKGAANMAPVLLEIQLTDFDLNTNGVTLAATQGAITWAQQKIVANVESEGALDISNSGDYGIGLKVHGTQFGQMNTATADWSGAGTYNYGPSGQLNEGENVGQLNKGQAGSGQRNYAVAGYGQGNLSDGGHGVYNKGSDGYKNVDGFDPLIALEASLTAMKGAGWSDENLTTIDANVDAILADTGTDGVLVSSGTGAKQISLSGGKVLLQATQSGVTIPTVTAITNGVSLADDAITSAKFDESTAFPVKSADTGATQIARVGADSDTLETLSDQLDAVALETTLTELKGDGWTSDESMLAIKTGIETTYDLLNTEVADILADTNEIQTELADGGRTDLLIDAIKAKTDNLPADPADDSDLDTAIAAIKSVVDDILVDTGTTLPATLETIDNFLDTEVAAILEDTGTTIPATLTTIEGKIDTIDGIADDILEDTGTTLPATLETIDNFLDTEVAAILEDTATTIPALIDALPTAAEIWASPTRTLTYPISSVTNPSADDPIEIYRDTTVIINFTGLGDVSAYAAAGDIAWFTIKENLDDADTSAILQMKTTSFGDSGAASTLLYVNGAAPTASDEGSFLFSDYVTGAATATLKAVAAVDLPVYAVTPVYWDIKATTAAGVVTILATGTAYIYATSTRTIS